MRLSPRDPSQWGFLAQLGTCHLILNHVDLATDYLIKARALNPQIWWVHFYLAGALGLKGDLDRGRASLAESLKLKPEIDSKGGASDAKKDDEGGSGRTGEADFMQGSK